MESIYSVFQFDVKLWFVNMWISQKVSGKMFYNLFVLATFFFWGHIVCNLWFGGQFALEVRLIVWKNVATLQTQIILYCFKTIHARDFLTHPRVLVYHSCTSQHMTFINCV